jgi:hypothetical protein
MASYAGEGHRVLNMVLFMGPKMRVLHQIKRAEAKDFIPCSPLFVKILHKSKTPSFEGAR